MGEPGQGPQAWGALQKSSLPSLEHLQHVPPGPVMACSSLCDLEQVAQPVWVQFPNLWRPRGQTCGRGRHTAGAFEPCKCHRGSDE